MVIESNPQELERLARRVKFLKPKIKANALNRFARILEDAWTKPFLNDADALFITQLKWSVNGTAEGVNV